MYNCAVLLAAGEGKRMKSATPKVLHKVCGKEMVNHVIDALREANIEDINVIVGNSYQEVQLQTKSRNVSFSFQKQQLGTGHAVKCAKEFLEGKEGNVAIFTGDAPLITSDTIKTLMEYHESNNFHGTILTSIIDNPTGYGRVLRKINGEVDKIIEHKDCSEEELRIKEINAGMYCFNIQTLLEVLNKLDNNNAQGEYYLTDVIEILKKDGKKVGALPVNFEETMGVNSRVQLAEVEAIMRKRINAMHLENGVTIIDPNNTYIDCDVVIHNDSIIYPGNVLQGKTEIKENCIIYPNSRIVDSVIEKDAVIQNSVILQSNIGEHTTVGPFAYIRPDSNIGSSVRIGDFVEIKKSTIGNNTKVSHLTYIGDASVGERCNFGCGTVVVNYDGKEKHKTIVGDDVFIGCNANLVSPVEVKDNSYIAAGSTITKEVPKGTLAIARSRQINKENWVKKKYQK